MGEQSKKVHVDTRFISVIVWLIELFSNFSEIPTQSEVAGLDSTDPENNRIFWLRTTAIWISFLLAILLFFVPVDYVYDKIYYTCFRYEEGSRILGFNYLSNFGLCVNFTIVAQLFCRAVESIFDKKAELERNNDQLYVGDMGGEISTMLNCVLLLATVYLEMMNQPEEDVLQYHGWRLFHTRTQNTFAMAIGVGLLNGVASLLGRFEQFPLNIAFSALVTLVFLLTNLRSYRVLIRKADQGGTDIREISI